MIAPLSVFAFLARLAVPQAISEWNLLILLFALIACIVGALNWFLANNELEGRPYWLLSFSGMALLSYLHGQSASVVCWGVLMVSVGGWVFLSENHPRKLDYLLPVALLTLSGIPFTPAASGIAGIAAGPFGGLNIFVWLSLAFILAGVIKFSLNKEKPMTHYENWVTLFCSIGMGVLILSAWSGLLFKLQGWNQITYWWAVAAILVILAGIVFLRYSKSGKNWLKNPQADHFYQTLKPFGSLLNQIFHFEWLYKILSFLFDVQKRIVNGLNLILEGEGGILWALVFLALLISLLASGRSGL